MSSQFLLEILIAGLAVLSANLIWHLIFFSPNETIILKKTSSGLVTLNKGKYFLIEFLITVITIIIFIKLMNFTGLAGYSLAFLLWAGLIFPVYFRSILISSQTEKSRHIIDSVYYLFSLLVIASILALL